jgi:hypothetical protein
MKRITLLFSILAAATSLSAQSFVAGWDFDGVGSNDTSTFANWGNQAGSASAFWTHSLADFTTVFSNEFGISTANNSAAANNSFSFLSSGIDDVTGGNTGFNEFSDNVSSGEFGFQSSTGDDTFSISFDGSNWTNLQLTYAFASDQGEAFSVQTIDIGSFDGLASAQYDFTPAANGVYDNLAITGTVVPEPSTYAAIFGVLALAFVAYRRRK